VQRRLTFRRLLTLPGPVFDIRRKSLLRGSVLALGSLWVSLEFTGYPEPRQSPWLIAPLLITCGATWDATRCMQRRWNLYHGGVILLIYVDLMILLMIAFLLLAPYSNVLL
jgi:hypothetical protein